MPAEEQKAEKVQEKRSKLKKVIDEDSDDTQIITEERKASEPEIREVPRPQPAAPQGMPQMPAGADIG